MDAVSLLLKLLYTAILLGVSGVLLHELWTVWFDARVYVGKFDIVSESGKDDEASAAFPRRVVGAQSILVQQLNDYQTRRAADAPTDSTYLLPGTTPLLLPPKVLEGVDITVQNVNIGQLLTVVRRGFLAPNEVRGALAVRAGSVLGAVDWSRAPGFADGKPPLQRFLVPNKASVQDAAAYVACSLAWARAASFSKEMAALSQGQFCDFATALGDLYGLGEKASSPSGLGAEETALVRKRVAQLRSYYGSKAVLPELYRLRADLLDLIPEKARVQGELVEAQEDRVRFAMLNPRLAGLPEEEKRFAALALARPAILFEKDGLSQPPENWAGLLRRYTPEIQAAAAATGLIVDGDGKPWGSGFIVAPGLMMTARFVLDAARPRREKEEAPARPLRLCLGISATCEAPLDIGDIIYTGEAAKSLVVLANLAGHDPLLNPPPPFSNPLPAANALIGRYAFVIGYPFRDARMPQQFVDRLLGTQAGSKRLMPGRVLAFGPRRDVGGSQPGFTTDISTSAGTGGGPLVDLTTGNVIGMSYAGAWQGERGKFAYAEVIPRAALDIIARRQRGEPDWPAEADPDATKGAPAPDK